MKKITFYNWRIDSQTRKLIRRIVTTLKTMLLEPKEPDIALVDVASYGEIKHSDEDGEGVVFGKAHRYIWVEDTNSSLRLLPSVEAIEANEDASIKESVLAVVKGLAEAIEAPEAPHEDSEQLSASVAIEGIKIGNDSVSDITIPEDTIDYIKKIRDLLGGGRIEFTKGDLHLVIE